MIAFYTACGGVDLFKAAEGMGFSIVGPDQFIPSNIALLGEQYPEDRSCHWYRIADGTNQQDITIDLAPERLGHCYDSFWQCYGCAGDMDIVALSFTDFLWQWLRYKGDSVYWCEPNFTYLGDAYD